MFSSKKGVSEITSFVLIVFIIIIAATSAYVFSKNALEEKIEELDKISMEQFFKKNDYLFKQITGYNGASSSISLSFRTGLLEFENNTMTYISLLPIVNSSQACFDNLCYSGEGGSLRMSLNLTSPYTFAENITLEPDVYVITYTHNKNDSTIEISVQ